MSLRFVKTGGVLFVGEENENGNLKNPRMIFADQNNGTVTLATCVANPELLEFDKFDFSYIGNDPDFETFYNNEVEKMRVAMETALAETPIILPPEKNIKIIK